MTCRHVLDLIDAGPFADYPDGHLEAARQHAGRCPRCGPALAAAARLDDGLARLDRESPIDVAATVMARIAVAKAPPPVVDEAPNAAPFPAPPSRWDWAASAPLLGLATSFAVFALAPNDVAAIGPGLGLGLGIPMGRLASSAGAMLVGFALYVLALRAPLNWRD